MWNKPTEISGGAYTSTGYELAAWNFGSVESALNGWKGSPAHNDVILNQGIWASQTWQAMGVGVDPTNTTYFLWFAAGADGAGAPELCGIEPPGPDVPALGMIGWLATFGLLALAGIALATRWSARRT